MSRTKRKAARNRTALMILFAAYCLMMIWLLFGQRADMLYEGIYAERLRHNFSLVPFRTTVGFISDLLCGEPEKVREAVINLGGNVIMFIPLGFLLAAIFRKIDRTVKCAAVTICIITAVEMVQLFTLLGVCDIDDLLLNTCGSLIGYGIWCAAARVSRRQISV